MKTLSYTQEYFLCAINNKGSIPVLDAAFPTCLTTGGILELLDHGYIVRAEKGKLVAGKAWDNKLFYVKPLYETIVSLKKPKDAKGVVMLYVSGLNQKPFHELFSTLGTSLVESGCADKLTEKWLLNEKTKYVPRAEAVTRTIEKVRAEFLEDGAITDETLYLAALLDNGKLIRHYFTKVETEIVKRRLKEVRKSDAYTLVKKTLEYVYSAWNGI